MGIVRSTFVIDEEGKIARIYDKVKVEGHVEAVSEFLGELSVGGKKLGKKPSK
jgi:peroxiredoxin Q/BCP